MGSEAQQWVESTGICHAQGSNQISDLPLSWEQCKTSCEGNPDCVSFWHSHLKGPAHNSWSVRCVQTRGSRGCNEQEKQASIQNYRDLGLDCCLDLSCPNNQYISGIAYANIWICANTWTKSYCEELCAGDATCVGYEYGQNYGGILCQLIYVTLPASCPDNRMYRGSSQGGTAV